MAASSSIKKLIGTAYIIESKGTHRHSIIWLHGFGDSSDGYKDIFTQMQPPNTRIILPNAPKRWQTIQGRRYNVQSWYEDKESEGSQITESIKELIDDELKLVEDGSHIIIGGFRYLFSFFLT
jgi:predicted esterase